MTEIPYPDLLTWHDEFTALRRDIHAHPETSYEEFRTSDLIAAKLKDIGVDAIERGLGGTGVVATIYGRSKTNRDPASSIALRADIDALNMVEENDLPYKSTIPGKMHGCGHDGHTAMLLAAGKYLAKHRSFDGTVYLIFQPAEEGGAGAESMIKDGLFDKFPVTSVWGMHNWPSMPLGWIGMREGPTMAAADVIHLTIHGKGSHAARPHLANDPVVIAAQLITALQSVASRNLNPFDQGVLSICVMRAGSADNVIPDRVTLEGTIRSFRPEVRTLMHRRLHEICAGIAMAFNTTIDVAISDGYPPVVNTAAETAQAAQAAISLLHAENVDTNLTPSMAGEDFAFMLEKVPGCYIRLGSGDGGSKPGLHDSYYDFNDAAIPLGAGYWVRLVETVLPTPHNGLAKPPLNKAF